MLLYNYFVMLKCIYLLEERYGMCILCKHIKLDIRVNHVTHVEASGEPLICRSI